MAVYPRPGDAALVWRMRGIGCKMPIRCLMAARSCGLSVALACSILEQETGGGVNEYGHDPTIFIGYGRVNVVNYRLYRRMRDIPRPGSHCQGVGPVQLTSYGYQSTADREGGCWRPLVNMKVGFRSLAENIRRDGLHAGVAAYNGSGPAAEHYADEVIMRAQRYAVDLRLPKP